MRAGMPAEFAPLSRGISNGCSESGKSDSDSGVELQGYRDFNPANHHYNSHGSTTTNMLSRRRHGIPSSLEEDGLSSRDGGGVVVGVVLVDDRGVGKVITCEGKPLVLGSVLLDRRAPLDTVSAEELRTLIAKQVPSLPGNFSFLSKDGWPVLKDQERHVRIDQVVTDKNAIAIRKQFEKTRAGIVTTSGDCLGFIFTDLYSNLNKVRDTIDDQLIEDKPLKSQYKFLERHGWPVTRTQESLLMVADVLVNCNLQIHLTSSPHHPALSVKNSYSCAVMPAVKQRRLSPATPSLSLPIGRPNSEDEADSKMWRWGNRNSKKSRKGFTIKNDSRPKDIDTSRVQNRDKLTAKPILLSYVRAEAAEHALILKEELIHYGHSVYLDVHEIKTGSDWQDALNFAVSNCEVFVPLITPMYGKTQWTNREVKLADVLQKLIIPINFLDQWPPDCLAIQFASTQYIPCKIPDSEHVKSVEFEKHSDYRVWDRKNIKKVALEISNRLKLIYKTNQAITQGILIDKSQYRNMNVNNTRKTFRYRFTSEPDEYNSIKDDGQKPLVVITAHPKQLLFADRLKCMMEAMNYEVWCSTELMDDTWDMDSLGGLNSGPLVSGALTPIPEGETLRPRKDQNGVDLSKKPLSRTDSHVVEKRALVRLSSQMSTTSFMGADSLSPSKIASLKKFQEKADVAGVAIVVVSEAFTKSTTSQQHVFYCEHRLHSVLIKVDNSPVPTIFSQLMGNDMLTNVESPQFECALKAQVKRALDPASAEAPKNANMESKMQYVVKFMKKNLPMIDSCVYISGSTKLQSRSEEICKEIGRALSKVRNLNVVTGGFYGAGDVTARAFEQGLQDNPRTPDHYADNTGATGPTGPIVHILPFKDQRDYKNKAHQNEEGSFEPVPYGKNLFVGDSVKEREAVVARLFDICIVVEGGPGAAHEVEEFIWNDHYVIPIISTGGAAGGQFGVPLKILETPPCVNESDWSILSEKEATPKEVANSVVKIVVALKQAIASHATVKLDKQEKMAAARAAKMNKKRSKRSKKLTVATHTQDQFLLNQSEESDINLKSLSLELQEEDKSEVSCAGHTGTKWNKFMTYFRPARFATHSK